MKFRVKYTAAFKKDYKRMAKRGKDMDKLLDVVERLCSDEPLPSKYKDHPLSGDYIGHRDCHIEPDWILVYYKTTSCLVLTLTRTGSHSDLF